MPRLRLHPDGLLGEHETTQAPGAWPNGTRVVKSRFDEGDAHPVGALATVIGSLAVSEADHQELRRQLRARGLPVREMPTHVYFVQWDTQPGIAVAVNNTKIRRQEAET